MRIVLFFVLGFGLTACPEIEPKTGPGTDYPCGVGWFVCGDVGAPSSTYVCCIEGNVCEHNPSRCETFSAKAPDAGDSGR